MSEVIDNAPTIEPRIEYGSDGEPYRLFISGGQVVPDTLQGWRYEERPTGTWIENELGYYCSRCGMYGWFDDSFCPNCGAKMKQEV